MLFPVKKRIFVSYFHHLHINAYEKIFTAFIGVTLLSTSGATVSVTDVVSQSNISSVLKAMPRQVSAPIQDETANLSRKCHSYFSVNGFVADQDNCGSVAQLVNAENGECQLVYPVAEMNTDPISGRIADDKATFNLPQVVRQVTIEEDGEQVTYDIVVAAFTKQLLDEGYETWLAPDNQTVIFNLGADGSLTASDPDVMIGVGIDMDEYGIQWTGFGDINIEMSPMTAETVEVPASLAVENYVVSSTDSPYIAQVGFDGNDVYVKGLISAMPESWIKGTLDEDGKVTFANGQYLGIARSATVYRNYTYCVVTTEDFDENWNIVYGDTEAPFVVDYDSEAKTFTFQPEDYLYMSLDPKDLVIRSFSNFVSLEYRGVFEPTTPPDPVVDYFEPYDPENGYAELDFTMPDYGADDKVLDYNNYYYNILVDGKPYEFTPEVYSSISAPMTDVPYSFTDNDDIYSYAEGYHIIYLRIPEYKSLAIQSVYTIDGVTHKSAVVTLDESSIDTPAAELSPVVSEQYFDLSGRAVANPSTGLYIRRATRADGTVTATKVVVK